MTTTEKKRPRQQQSQKPRKAKTIRTHGGRRTTPRSKHHPEPTWATEPVFCRPSRIYFERRLTDADGGLQR